MVNFAQLGIEVDSRPALDGASNLDKLTAAGERAEKATDRLKKATTDWAAEQQKANSRAREMEQADIRRTASTNKANTSIREQQQELAKLIGQIDPTVAALEKLDERERKLASFRKSGLLPQNEFDRFSKSIDSQRQKISSLSSATEISSAATERETAALAKQNAIRDRLAALVNTARGQKILEAEAANKSANANSNYTNSANRAGMSTRAYSAAMRNVPAQITDITTSLIGGQPAYLVAIQQGGQLKDMFGGIVPAARALATSLLGMINPITVAAAAIGTLGVAFYQSSQQQEDLEKALISSGRFAGVNREEVNKLADAYDKMSGVTRGQAIDALTQVAASGRLSGEQFRLATESALRWSSVTGESVDSVVDKFNEIARDPVNALLKLNETERFLTQTQYDRIKALQDEGRFQDAATEAARIYADTVAGRATEIEANLGLISTAWKNIKTGAREAWDEIVSGIDRVQGPLQTLADRIAGLGTAQRTLVRNALNTLSPVAGGLIGFGGDAFRGVSSSVDSTASSGGTNSVIDSAEVKRLQEANQQWQSILGNSNRHAQIENEVLRIRKAGLAAGINELEIEKRVTEYRVKQAEIDAKKNRPKANTDNKAADTLVDSARRQIEANKQLADSGEQVSTSQRIVIQINQRLADSTNTMTAATRAELVAAKEMLLTTDAQSKARQQLTRDTAANAAATERLAQVYKQQQEQNEVALLSIGRGGQAAEIAQRELNLRREYLTEVDKLEKIQRNKNTALSAEEYQRQKDMLANSLEERLSLERSFQDQRMAMQADWRNGFTSAFEDYNAQAQNTAGQFKTLFENAFKGAEDALVKFAMTGKFSFTDFANSIIADLTRIAAKQAISGLVSSIAGAIAGGGASNSSGVGSTQLGNNYNWRGSFSSGGYTGDGGKYQPKGIVHAGEVVWSQKDVAAVGGPKRANAMRPTAGYANGGIVGSSSSMRSSAPEVSVVINNQGGALDVQSQSTRQMPNGKVLVELVTSTVKSGFNSGMFDSDMGANFGVRRVGRA